MYDPTATQRESLLAWTIVALYCCFVLAFVAFGLISFGAAFADDNTLLQSVLFVLIGLAMFIYPCVVIRRSVRRWRATGRLCAATEEWLAADAQRKAWQHNEQNIPMRSRVIKHTITYGAIYLGMIFPSLGAVIKHRSHSSNVWLYLLVLILIPWSLTLWNSFSKSKDSR
jgi:hypothetical protein